MILNAIAEKLKRQSKDDFKGRHFEAWLIVQAVAWYLRYPLSYRDLEEMFRERGRSGPQHDQPLGPCLCACHREAAAAVSAPALWFGPYRRDLRQNPWQVALSIPRYRQARKSHRLPAHREARP